MGIPASAEEYIRTVYPALARLARSIAKDWSEAEDLLQNTVTKTFVSWRKVSAADDPDAYVHRIMMNCFLSERRRGWFTKERVAEDIEVVSQERHPVPSGTTATENRDLVLGLLARLPRQQRAVLALRYLEDRPDEQIADMLGCSRQAVASAAYRGLRQLREHLIVAGSDLAKAAG